MRTFSSFIFLLIGPTLFARTGEIIISEWKGGARAAVSVTYDDLPSRGWRSLIEGWEPLHAKYAIKGDLAMVSGGTGDVDWVAQRQVLERGWFRAMAHTHTHPRLSSLEAGEVRENFEACNNFLSREMGLNVPTLVYPFGNYNAQVASIAAEFYLGSRKCAGGANRSRHCEYQEIESEYLVGTTTKTEVEGWIDRALRNKEWLVTTGHAIKGIDDGWEPAPAEVYEYEFAQVKSGAIWNDHFENVLKYLIEKNNTTTTVNSWSAAEVRVALSLGEVAHRDLLNFPLSLEVEIPQEWSSVEISQNGNKITETAVRRGSKNWVLFEAIPSDREIVLSRR